MEVVRGFQVKQDDGRFVFVSQEELYSKTDDFQSVTQKEYELLFQKLYTKKISRPKRPTEHRQFSMMRLLTSASLTLIGVAGTISYIEMLGLVFGILATGGTLIVILAVVWFFRFMFDLDEEY